MIVCYLAIYIKRSLHQFSLQRHKKFHKSSSVRQQGRRKASHQAKARRRKEADGRPQKQQRKKQQQLSENPSIPPVSIHLLEDSCDDDEDKPSDYELLLSTFKPLAKKPRLMADKREKMKDTTISSVSGGGGQDFRVSIQEGEGRGVIEERGGEQGSPADEDSCSDGGEADNDDAAGKGFCS